MPHPAPLRLLLALSLAFVPAFAAKPKAVPADAAPQLISTQGGGPKWKNVAELQSFAAKGDPQACFELGERSLEGDGVPKDAAKAIPLFETAAKGGITNAWFKLGKIYHDGLTGTPDYGWALEYFGNAARARVAEAQHNLGAMLVSARGVKRVRPTDPVRRFPERTRPRIPLALPGPRPVAPSVRTNLHDLPQVVALGRPINDGLTPVAVLDGRETTSCFSASAGA